MENDYPLHRPVIRGIIGVTPIIGSFFLSALPILQMIGTIIGIIVACLSGFSLWQSIQIKKRKLNQTKPKYEDNEEDDSD